MARRPVIERECGVCGQTRRIAVRARDGQPDMCPRCAPNATAPCGVCGQVSRIAVRATANRPAVGRCCYEAPVTVCSRCGRRRACHHAGTDRPVCAACSTTKGECGFCGRAGRIVRKARDGSPALGICCYRLPLGVCVDCGRERPCYHASDQPVCPSCTAVRRAQVCVGCRQRRKAQRRVEGGILCQTCDIKQGNTTGSCQACGQTGRLTSGICAGCKLGVRVDRLAAGADPDVAATLGPFLARIVQ